MKKVALFNILLACLMLLSACSANGDLLSDCGIDSLGDIEACTIYHDEYPLGVEITDMKTLQPLLHYRYLEECPVTQLHELLLVPGEGTLFLTVGDSTFAFHRMEDGSIGAKTSSESGYRIYQAPENRRLTSKRFLELIEANI